VKLTKAHHEIYPNSDKFIPKTIKHLNIILLPTLKPLNLPIPFVPATKIFYSFLSFHICAKQFSHPFFYNRLPYSFVQLQFTELLLTQFSVSPCHFFPLRHTRTSSSEELITSSQILSSR